MTRTRTIYRCNICKRNGMMLMSRFLPYACLDCQHKWEMKLFGKIDPSRGLK